MISSLSPFHISTHLPPYCWMRIYEHKPRAAITTLLCNQNQNVGPKCLTCNQNPTVFNRFTNHHGHAHRHSVHYVIIDYVKYPCSVLAYRRVTLIFSFLIIKNNNNSGWRLVSAIWLTSFIAPNPSNRTIMMSARFSGSKTAILGAMLATLQWPITEWSIVCSLCGFAL